MLINTTGTNIKGACIIMAGKLLYVFTCCQDKLQELQRSLEDSSIQKNAENEGLCTSTCMAYYYIAVDQFCYN